MKYLLDTHALIWSIVDKQKLSSPVRQILENPSNPILVSAISFWEISLKFSLGKLDLQGIVPDDFPRLVIETKFETISLDVEESATYHHLIAAYHRDPFDKMLIWQAIKNNYTLISKDVKMQAYQSAGLKLFW